MIKGVCNQLRERFGMEYRLGARTECPFCGHHTFSIRRDDTLAKCFHPTCGQRITANCGGRSEIGALHPVLERVYRDFYVALLAQEGNGPSSAYSYSVDERKIHPQVLKDSMLGVVPEGYDLDAVFDSAKTKTDNDKLATKIGEAKDKLATCLRGHSGWLCFFYTDQYHRITSIRLRQPYSKNILYFKPFDTAGLFGHSLLSPKPGLDLTGLSDNLLVVEGEFNQLQLQSLLVYRNQDTGEDWNYVPACAIGGVDNADFKTLAAVCPKPIICYDNDTSKAGFQLVDKARDHMSLSACTTPELDSDLDQFIRSFGGRHTEAWKGVKTLLSEARSYSMRFESVAKGVFDLRCGKGKVHEINGKVAERIRNDMVGRGRFYWDDQAAYFQEDDSHQLIRIDPKCRECALYLDNYGINPTEPIYPHIVAHLANKAFKHGNRSDIFHLSHYDQRASTVHLNNHNNQIIRITADGRNLVANGSDGVLFLADRAAAPFKIGGMDASSTLFRDLILNRINFAPDNLTPGERRWLFSIWFYSLFFDSIMRTRPILTMLGEQGSGKSSTLRWLGILLYGPHFDVTPLPHKSDDFDVAITNSDFLAVDNADSRRPWLEDRLAIVATGAQIKRRILYTTNDPVSIRVRCALGITARTPRFHRPDVAQRLLMMKVAPLSPHQFRSESVMVEEILDNRDLMMTEAVGQIQEVLEALQTQEGYQGTGGLRMADFGNFAMKIARHTGKEAEAQAILSKLTAEQSTFALEDDIVFELLPRWIERNRETEVTYAELCDALAKLAAADGIDFMYRGQHKSFAQRMRNLRPGLEQYFVIRERTTHGGKKCFQFRLRSSCGEDNDTKASTHPTHSDELPLSTAGEQLKTQG